MSLLKTEGKTITVLLYKFMWQIIRVQEYLEIYGINSIQIQEKCVSDRYVNSDILTLISYAVKYWENIYFFRKIM